MTWAKWAKLGGGHQKKIKIIIIIIDISTEIDDKK